MKIRMIGLMVLCLLVASGCRTEMEPYESRREKTPDMQDAKILAHKTETLTTELPVTEPEEPEEEAPETETTEDVSDTETPETDEGYPLTVELNGFLNMREGPSVMFDVVVLLAEGDTIELLGEETEEDTVWYRVVYDGEVGYVEQEAMWAVSGPEE